VCFAGSACIWARGRSDPLLVFSHLRRSPKRLARDGGGRAQPIAASVVATVAESSKKENPMFTGGVTSAQFFYTDRFTHIDYGMLSVCNFEVLPRAF
jgi:hypothetical protein